MEKPEPKAQPRESKASDALQPGTYFCDQLVGFGNNVFAAVIAFSFAMGYDVLRDLWLKIEIVQSASIHPAAVPGLAVGPEDFYCRLWAAIALVFFVIDDWYGSRQHIAQLRLGLLSPKLAYYRFMSDILAGVSGYAIIMTAVHGSRLFGGLMALYLGFATFWTLVCIIDVQAPDKILDRLSCMLVCQLLECVAILAYFFKTYGTDWYAWTGRYSTSNYSVVFLILMVVIGNRLLPLVFTRGRAYIRKHSGRAESAGAGGSEEENPDGS